MTEQDYFEQFAGVETTPENIVQTDEDMQAFNEMYRAKWANEHWAIIQEWRDMQSAKEQDDRTSIDN